MNAITSTLISEINTLSFNTLKKLWLDRMQNIKTDIAAKFLMPRLGTGANLKNRKGKTRNKPALGRFINQRPIQVNTQVHDGYKMKRQYYPSGGNLQQQLKLNSKNAEIDTIPRKAHKPNLKLYEYRYKMLCNLSFRFL